MAFRAAQMPKPSRHQNKEVAEIAEKIRKSEAMVDEHPSSISMRSSLRSVAVFSAWKAMRLISAASGKSA